MSLQGMDFIHIFPVIQWLVKKSIEWRTSKGESIKRHAIRRFNTCHPDLREVRVEMGGNKSESTFVCVFKRNFLSLPSLACYFHSHRPSVTECRITFDYFF